MHATRLGLLILVLLPVISHAQDKSVTIYQPRRLSLAEYISDLDDLSKLASQPELTAENTNEAFDLLRGGWKVVDHGTSFNVPTDSIFDQFEKLGKAQDEQLRTSLLDQLRILRAEAQAYERVPPDSSAAHAKLNQILSRREFNQVHGPTWWDRLKYRILMWIFRLLSRFFGTSAAPTIGKVLVWSLVAIAVIVTAFFVYRAIRQSARIESIVPQVLPVSAKGWRVWMQEAQAAAGSGNWRDAVHLTYWAGISFLEQSGMWRPDQARTPREYLRLLPAGSERRPPLSALTRTLEQTWYGSRPAGPETFSEAITLVEELGCRQA